MIQCLLQIYGSSSHRDSISGRLLAGYACCANEESVSVRIKMPTAWFSLKKSLNCKSAAEDVHDPPTQRSSRERRRGQGLSNYVHPNITRSALIPSSCSPQSMASGEFLNPASLHEVIVNDSWPMNIPRRKSNPGSTRPSPPADRCAVTELCKGDFSRNIVEIIFRTGWPKPCESIRNNISNNNSNKTNGIINGNGDPCERIQRVLKVHNMQATVARFEEYREMVKARASRLSRKHPRCMADGNELLRFHGTTLRCSLGMNGDSNLCTMAGCNVCRIIRTGFSHCEGKQGGNSGCNRGIYTTSTSGRAHESPIPSMPAAQRAMIVCRVIAGRVLNNPMDKFGGLPFPVAKFSGFDSVAGESVSPYCSTEELFVFNSRAVLPCFVVVYRSD